MPIRVLLNLIRVTKDTPTLKLFKSLQCRATDFHRYDHIILDIFQMCTGLLGMLEMTHHLNDRLWE